MGNIVDLSEVQLELGLADSITDNERAIIATAITRAEGAVRRFLNYDPVLRSRIEFYPTQRYNTQSLVGVFEVTDTHAFIRERVSGATNELQLQHIPIRDSIRVFVDYDGRSGDRAGSFGIDTELTRGEDFWLNNDTEGICRDGIVRSFGLWPQTPGTIRVVYSAGYSLDEIHGKDTAVDASPIMDAIIDEASRRARKAFILAKKVNVGFVAGPFQSERLGDYMYSLGTSNNPLIDRAYGGLYDLLPENREKLQEFLNYGWALS